MNGPYDTRETALQPVTELRAANPEMSLQEINWLILQRATAGMKLGEYDRYILGWLTGMEPQTCAVIAGLIHRARENG